ncbi:MAG: phosphoribosylglycinamide formyltransferase [Spirochaetota bacterium]
MKKKVVSFLVSGRGSNFKTVAEKIISGYIPATCGIVLSNKADAMALETARDMGIPACAVLPGRYSSREAHEEALVAELEARKTDLVVAAGYMRILTPYFVRQYKNRIINIHPALLPSFPGVNAQEQALRYGVKITGCTAHFIDEGTDTGPIILQKAIPVLDNDTVTSLSKRILTEEHRVLPEAVKLFCEDRLRVNGRRVNIL